MTERILTHMNNDHQLSLYDYLEYYGNVKVSNGGITSVKMVDLQLDKLTLQYTRGGQSHTADIAISPPMESMGEARKVLVEMAKTSANALGKSPNQLKSFAPPSRPNEIFAHVLIGSLYLLLVAPKVWEKTFGVLINLVKPSLTQFFIKHYWMPGATALAVHAGESLFLVKPKLDKYRVPMAPRIKWVLCHLVEGFPAIQRLNAKIKEIEH